MLLIAIAGAKSDMVVSWLCIVWEAVVAACRRGHHRDGHSTQVVLG
jgi:hypothetical protein